ncbi:unnamed protein product [Ixodes hexagonus]
MTAGPTGGGCRPPQACVCSGAFRSANYVFDAQLGHCRLVPEHRCLDRSKGFTDHRQCEDTCGAAVSRAGSDGADARCKAGPVEPLLRACRWADQRFGFFYDPSTMRCRRWGDGICAGGAHGLISDLSECLAQCP